MSASCGAVKAIQVIVLPDHYTANNTVGFHQVNVKCHKDFLNLTHVCLLFCHHHHHHPIDYH